ncbi:ArsR/SmtB family transcription factor [Microtetraspora malaysiensis]|uniref:ArsR/SmtB family transcription factor n=1 Tax=Microtetraspora malaysiensis TaxID=161358 RepID=UPI003D94648B
MTIFGENGPYAKIPGQWGRSERASDVSAAVPELTVREATCQSWLTGVTLKCRGGVLTSEELLAVLAALGHPQRLRIIARLAEGRVHVSELARRVGISRPLLYMHLERMEKAGLVTGDLELSPDGKAMKYFQLVPFDVRLSVDTVLDALLADEAAQRDEAARMDQGSRNDDREGPDDMQEPQS